MKVLVTGATGFTGDKLARKLYKSGKNLKILVRDQSQVKVDKEYSPEIIEGDIRDIDTVEKAVEGCDFVFHLAAVFRTAGIPDQTYYDVHVKGTENLLNASFKNNITRFIHCSTVGVHGDIDNPPANECSPFKPGDIYQRTKLKGELLATDFHHMTGLPVTIIRPTAIYGPGDLRLLKLFKLASQKITPIIGDGKVYYHMVYIDDLVDAFILSSGNENAVGETFIIGGKERKTLNELIDTISECLGKPSTKIHFPALPFQLLGSLCEKICIPLHIEPPIYRRRVDFFTKSRCFDTLKANNSKNFSPNISIQKGIQNTIDWYKMKMLL